MTSDDKAMTASTPWLDLFGWAAAILIVGGAIAGWVDLFSEWRRTRP